jgi:hypothetical protein
MKIRHLITFFFRQLFAQVHHDCPELLPADVPVAVLGPI